MSGHESLCGYNRGVHDAFCCILRQAALVGMIAIMRGIVIAGYVLIGRHTARHPVMSPTIFPSWLVPDAGLMKYSTFCLLSHRSVIWCYFRRLGQPAGGVMLTAASSLRFYHSPRRPLGLRCSGVDLTYHRLNLWLANREQ